MASELNVWLHNNPYTQKKEAKPHSDAILQQLLQNTMNTSSEVEILINENGKPYIKGPIFFSHSNSANLYAYVVTEGHEIAIDVEVMKDREKLPKLARRYFHRDEIKYLDQFSGQAYEDHFYQLWTRKEAWCKLDGGTLWSYLHRSVLSGAQLKTQQGETIYMQTLPNIKGFACSVAATQVIEDVWLNNIGILQ